MRTVDGAQGKGGGQILRTSLSLALITGQPLRIQRIRASRRRPGLLRQHLTAVRAAAEVGHGSQVEGAELHSSELTFRPGPVRAGDFHFAIGSAGSTTLVLQTVLLPLLVARGRSTVTLEGGTHNPMAPSFEFLTRSFLPLLARMGATVDAHLVRHGFYPAGGSRIQVELHPMDQELKPLRLTRRGASLGLRARAVVANLPRSIGEREVSQVRRRLSGLGLELDDEQHAAVESDGPGNALFLEQQSEELTEVFTGFGEKGVPAERVADQLVHSARGYLQSDVAVGPHLADQLLLPMALASGGTIHTLPPTDHTRTNIDVIRGFLPRVELCPSSPIGTTPGASR